MFLDHRLDVVIVGIRRTKEGLPVEHPVVSLLALSSEILVVQCLHQVKVLVLPGIVQLLTELLNVLQFVFHFRCSIVLLLYQAMAKTVICLREKNKQTSKGALRIQTVG